MTVGFYEKKINSSKILRKLNLNSLQYFLVSFHREENIDDEDNFMKFGVEVLLGANCQDQNVFSPGGTHGGNFTILTKFTEFQNRCEYQSS